MSGLPAIIGLQPNYRTNEDVVKVNQPITLIHTDISSNQPDLQWQGIWASVADVKGAELEAERRRRDKGKKGKKDYYERQKDLVVELEEQASQLSEKLRQLKLQKDTLSIQQTLLEKLLYVRDQDSIRQQHLKVMLADMASVLPMVDQEPGKGPHTEHMMGLLQKMFLLGRHASTAAKKETTVAMASLSRGPVDYKSLQQSILAEDFTDSQLQTAAHLYQSLLTRMVGIYSKRPTIEQTFTAMQQEPAPSSERLFTQMRASSIGALQTFKASLELEEKIINENEEVLYMHVLDPRQLGRLVVRSFPNIPPCVVILKTMTALAYVRGLVTTTLLQNVGSLEEHVMSFYNMISFANEELGLRSHHPGAGSPALALAEAELARLGHGVGVLAGLNANQWGLMGSLVSRGIHVPQPQPIRPWGATHVPQAAAQVPKNGLGDPSVAAQVTDNQIRELPGTSQLRDHLRDLQNPGRAEGGPDDGRASVSGALAGVGHPTQQSFGGQFPGIANGRQHGNLGVGLAQLDGAQRHDQPQQKGRQRVLPGQVWQAGPARVSVVQQSYQQQFFSADRVAQTQREVRDENMVDDELQRQQSIQSFAEEDLVCVDRALGGAGGAGLQDGANLWGTDNTMEGYANGASFLLDGGPGRATGELIDGGFDERHSLNVGQGGIFDCDLDSSASALNEGMSDLLLPDEGSILRGL